MSDVVYLDAAAAAPLAPEALEVMLRSLQGTPGSPSSTHVPGRLAARAVEIAREQVAQLLESGPASVTFVGSATEANNLVLRGLELDKARSDIVSSVAEHDSVLTTSRGLSSSTSRVTLVGINTSGEIDLDELRNAVSERTALISVQAANNETGVVQPIEAISDIAHEIGALLHVDGSQIFAWGHYPPATTADFVTVSSHKMHGPQGASALVATRRARSHLHAQLTGGGQERGLRSGTPNVAAIAGFGAAAELAQRTGREAGITVAALRDRLRIGLARSIPGVIEHGFAAHHRLSGILNAALGTNDRLSPEADAVLARSPRVAASTGSACHAGAPTPSRVLLAMGVTEWEAARSLRLSLSRYTTAAEVDEAVRVLSGSYRELLEMVSAR